MVCEWPVSPRPKIPVLPDGTSHISSLSLQAFDPAPALPAAGPWWDHANMSEKNDENTQKQPLEGGYAGSPTTQQMRTVGQRRRDAEEKLEHHLEEARHKVSPRHDNAPAEEEADRDRPDIAAIQNDERLTAADRVDLIANQVITDDDGGGAPDHDNKG